MLTLLQDVLDNYLEAGTIWRREDVAQMLYDGIAEDDAWLPAGTRFAEGDTIWIAAYEGRRGLLVSDQGDVLWAYSNGHVTLASTDQVARWEFPWLAR